MRTVWAFELVFLSVGPLPDLASLDPTSPSEPQALAVGLRRIVVPAHG
ncbi:hypothetical protein Pla52n_04480 [Stieleria varia]|uniref:Uncharacterized protein n=1 Tax=Stieleria varia TaxID=2528005 RepID=A0A5C6B8B3_9BACT|nr:hypothetical protein Pla52n_04480 [Stieleria varia]